LTDYKLLAIIKLQLIVIDICRYDYRVYKEVIWQHSGKVGTNNIGKAYYIKSKDLT